MNKKNIASGFFITGFKRIFTQVAQILLSIIIARLVSPSDYGILGIIMVLVHISTVFIDNGLGSALIYKHNLNQNDINTVFTFNVCLSSLFYIIIFFTAPFISSFFEIPSLNIYLKVCSIIIFIDSLYIVSTAILKVQGKYTKLAIANFSSTTISGIVGIFFAYIGLGIWALVIQSITKSCINLLILTTNSVKPKFGFKISSFKALFSYSINIFTASSITKIVEEFTTFFIGKVYNAYDLGIYSRSSQFAMIPNTGIGSAVNVVIFPTLSGLKNNLEAFSHTFKEFIIKLAIISIPIYFTLSLIAKPMIMTVLTEKWQETIIYLQILCFGRILCLISTVTIQALNACGRTDLSMKQQFYKLGIKTIMLFSCMFFGLFWVVIAEALYNIIQYFITNCYSKKILGYGIKQQIYDIYKYIIICIIDYIICYYIMSISNSYIYQLFAGITMFIVIYLIAICLIGEKHQLISIINLIKRK